MSRFARQRRVFFVEEPLYGGFDNRLDIKSCPASGVVVVTPLLKSREDPDLVLHDLILRFARQERIVAPIVWFYTPMAIGFFPPSLAPSAIIYDCMDELSLFRGAPPELISREQKLFEIADLVFTGGVSLFEEKRKRHPRVSVFPSGVDTAHFRRARLLREGGKDQLKSPRPRVGYAGVIDERIDVPLITGIAESRPDWDLVMIGPVVKIDKDSLPQRKNIHWLGMRDYQDLPAYFAEWDVAIMPFALNESTRFISPTKTPEYLAAGLPVVSTPIVDVVRPYGVMKVVEIAGSAPEFVCAIERSLGPRNGQQEMADAYLENISWDSVWSGMNNSLELLSKPCSAPISTKLEAVRV